MSPALVGVAPTALESGHAQGRRLPSGAGGEHIRQVLYMVGDERQQIGIRCSRRPRPVYGRGKFAEGRIVAVMRKMITMLHAMVPRRLFGADPSSGRPVLRTDPR